MVSTVTSPWVSRAQRLFEREEVVGVDDGRYALTHDRVGHGVHADLRAIRNLLDADDDVHTALLEIHAGLDRSRLGLSTGRAKRNSTKIQMVDDFAKNRRRCAGRDIRVGRVGSRQRCSRPLTPSGGAPATSARRRRGRRLPSWKEAESQPGTPPGAESRRAHVGGEHPVARARR